MRSRADQQFSKVLQCPGDSPVPRCWMRSTAIDTPRFLTVFTDIHRNLMKKTLNIDSEFDALDPERTELVRDLAFKEVLFKKVDLISSWSVFA